MVTANRRTAFLMLLCCSRATEVHRLSSVVESSVCFSPRTRVFMLSAAGCSAAPKTRPRRAGVGPLHAPCLVIALIKHKGAKPICGLLDVSS